MKTKKEIAIWLTDKNRKKVQGILEMFGEKTSSDTTLSLSWYIEYDRGKWSSSSDDKLNEIRVKPKELRAILASEKLKPNDVIINKGNVTVVVTEITHLGSSTFNGKYKDGKEYSINYSAFKRYATREEIEALEGKTKELEARKWYFGELDNNNRTLFYFNGVYGQSTQNGFDTKRNWSNKIGCIQGFKYREATQQEVEETLIKEAKKRGIKNGVKVKALKTGGVEECNLDGDECNYYKGNNRLYYGGILVFDNGRWVEVIQEVDKFAELKEAYKNGAVIQYFSSFGIWENCKPYWCEKVEYRIKPEEKPKIGDVVKVWNNNSSAKPIIGTLEDLHLTTHYGVGGYWYDNAEHLTQQQVIDLLFNNK